MSVSIPPLHAAFIDAICSSVAADDRFMALLAGGSFIHGGIDRHSDLDLVLVARDDALDDVMASRTAFARSLGPVISAFTGEHVGEPRLLICLYGPPLLHVDLKFVSADDLDRRIERPALLFAREEADIAARIDNAAIAWPDHDAQWFEDRIWTWLHYAATKVARGELYEALGMLAWLREQVIGPMLYRRAGRPQRGVRRIEASGVDPDGLLAATLASHDPAEIRSALMAVIDIYVALRADEPPPAPALDMPGALVAWMEQN